MAMLYFSGGQSASCPREFISNQASVVLRIFVLIAACLAPIWAGAASDRELAEWVIRWEGRVILEGNRQPITDLAQLPKGEIRIAGIDLTGAVMHPSELVRLAGLVS